ncbi:glycosyltransferase [Croceicoccus mobilis]|uniref:Glycosyl transferase family 1 n=1 Tax=Croceicoccus mobilis TaxID=1703339 RepID=A0A916Z9L8_9SPHN|nr:glycosyltransferase [Croceicoccus mobilis]GGD83243.1 glycosyl transferase family 1 [Croceicoccus mobilis]
MKIAVISHIRHAIAPPFMGGMEAHCASLCDGLLSAGHEPVLFAPEGSRADCEIVPICDAPYEDVLPWAQWRGTERLDAYQRHAFEKAWDHIRARSFDAVHNNSLYPELITTAVVEGVPLVTSQHVPPFGKMREAVHKAVGVGHVRQTVTSQSQLPLWFDECPSNMAVVHNGIDCDFWRPQVGRGDGALVWTGRITPNKGTAQAVRAAMQAGVKLDLVGSIENEIYFEQEVAPLLGKNIRYLGHRQGGELRDIVARARALCVTPMWEEPFGLVAAEALACDIPVIAFERGAMAEVVGDCGALIAPGDVDALARAMADPPSLDHGHARARALKFFCTQTMVEGYVREYCRAISAASAFRAADGARAA